MIRAARVLASAAALAALAALAGSALSCSKFGDSSTDPTDAGEAADTAPPTVDGGGVMTPRRLYMFGGYTTEPTTESRPSAYVSTVGSDGEPGPWTRVKGLDDDRYHGAWLQTDTSLFAFGGTVQGNSAAKDGARAMLGPEPVGDTKVWSPTAQMATGRDYPSSFVRGTDVYVTGGKNGSSALGNVERYVPGMDKFFPAGSMPAVAGHTAILHDASMYLIGGDRGSAGPTASVMKAGFDTDGSVLTFENGGALKQVAAYHAFAVVEPWVFIIGGIGNSGAAVRDVMRGQFVTGMLTTDIIAPLPTPGQKGIAASCTVVIDHTIYVMGGRDVPADPSKGDVYIGRVDGGGVVTWTVAKNPLPEGRAAFGCAVGP